MEWQWNVTMLAVHLIAFVLAVMLCFRAPCWMQKLVMVGFAFAFAVVCGAYIAALAGEFWWWWGLVLGLSIEHISVLIYLFRIVHQGGLRVGPAHRTAPAH